MVFDNGQVVEYDTPKNLLRNKKGIFYGLAKEANLIKWPLIDWMVLVNINSFVLIDILI